MGHRSYSPTPYAAAVLLTLSVFVFGQAQNKTDKATVPEAEAKAANAIRTAPDTAAKLTAAAEFIKKYPRSGARKQVADYIADAVNGEKDANQKLAFAQKALAIFTEPNEVSDLKPALIDAYIKLDRFDEAFSEGASFLAKNPDDVQILMNLAIVGTEQGKRQNAKYIPQASQYGAKAIELIEADKLPANVDTVSWNRYKSMLPQLYQEMGIISFMQQDVAGATSKLEKASKLNPADPFNYLLLANITNSEYQQVAKTHRDMPESKAKDDLLQKASGLIDKMIELNAHAVALSEGKAPYQQVHDRALEDLSFYYKYRHQNSTEGMQKLIDGFKLPASP